MEQSTRPARGAAITQPLSTARPRRKRLTLALLGALAGLAAPALAPMASAAAEAQRFAFDIPAKPRLAALADFTAVTGIQVLRASTEQLAGNAAPLVGEYSAEQALQRLLAGSGLSYRFTAGGAVALQRSSAAGDEALLLGPLRVRGETRGSGALASEGTGSYTVPAARSATRLTLSPRETPQSIQVITRQQMDDQAMNNLDDVVKNATGLVLQKYGSERVRYMSRGFQVDNIQYDGLPSTISTYVQDVISSADLALYDRIEIVRGATGLLQGSGNPAAAINLVRKRPTEQTQFSASASAGSWDNYRVEGDISGALNDSGSIRARAVAAYQDKDHFMDYMGEERSLLYGIIEGDLTEATTLTFGVSMQNANVIADWGLLPMNRDGSDMKLPRSTYLGADWARWDKDNTFTFLELEHRFSNGWSAKAVLTRIDATMDMLGSYLHRTGVPLTSQDVVIGAGGYKYDEDQTMADLYASGPFTLFGREHELVVGGNLRKEKFRGHGGGVDAARIDPHNWQPSSLPKPALNYGAWFLDRDEDQAGLYVASRWRLLDPLTLIVGGRLSWYDFESATGPTVSDYSVDREFTPYAGLIYDLNDTYSLYASYTEIFKAQSQYDVAGNLLEPVTGDNFEAGIKGEFHDGALNASLAVFQVVQQNRSQQDLEGPSPCLPYYPTGRCYRAAGEVESEGVELDIAGAITENWQLAFGFTHVKAEYSKDLTNQGKPFDTDTPRNLVKLSTTYQLPGALHRLKIGGSIQAQSSIYNEGISNNIPWKIEEDTYTIVNLMANYQITDNLSAALNVNNVFDKNYYMSLGTPTGSNMYGDPRNFLVTVKWVQ